MLVLEISFRTSQKKLFSQGRLDPPFLPPLRWSLPHPLEPSHIPLSPSIPARPVPSSRSSPPSWNWLQPSPYPPLLSRLNEAFSPPHPPQVVGPADAVRVLDLQTVSGSAPVETGNFPDPSRSFTSPARQSINSPVQLQGWAMGAGPARRTNVQRAPLVFVVPPGACGCCHGLHSDVTLSI